MAVSGKSIGTGGLISRWNVLPYFNGMEYPVRQTGVVAANGRIVFSMNLCRITGIARKVIDENEKRPGLQNGEKQKSQINQRIKPMPDIMSRFSPGPDRIG